MPTNEALAPDPAAPLAERTRPRALQDVVGQEHLTGPGRPLRRWLEERLSLSLILWGPPGTGKTTLARLLAAGSGAHFESLSAVLDGVKEVRAVLERAERRHACGERTVVFIDELHRFNKAQQDALLAHVERGQVILIGATTENPSFEIIPALVSRCQVYRLRPLEAEDLRQILQRALQDPYIQALRPELEDEETLLRLSGGDARRMLNGLELALSLAVADADGRRRIRTEHVEAAFQQVVPRYDKAGEGHYDTISAFIKSVRGSDPDAALYWLAVMLEAGEDPLFIARRLIILAAEDIGNANPNALLLATAAFDAVHRIGLPEARIVLAQLTTFLAGCEKSNAAYRAIENALEEVRREGARPVPLHLRNPVTALMRQEGYGSGYVYPHETPEGFARLSYFPEGMQPRLFYRPTGRGYEARIRAWLNRCWPDRYKEEPDGV
ncbi:MAG: replication-associated recombination protein A [Bacteroidetes bacterium]|nr:replication-associated recombination protein A [Rhodothermia bacterium]MCS7154265.1 replication-associated recombination protein A [Bacteroidota bacterium]MCX7906699.1 replication-associated recombination protein A [Bacteroidota bacterium]MDW8137021.1 replication-associated recombination protein A [Bacteroidota bacterium]MDW8285108.1 replication-associated recombination protein A [Bacteroidota bacterium]